MLQEYSRELAALVAAWRGRLVHIGGRGIAGRTGVVVGENLVASLARDARDGEELSLIGPDGQQKPATVKAWDRRSGLVLLDVPGLGPVAPLQAAEAPRLGQLALGVAFPSANGVEASLAMIRYVGGATRFGSLPVTGHFQTDGQAFPGFGGSVVLDPGGKLLGVVVENAPGNQGWILPAAEWLGMVAGLFANGSWRRPWIGVALMPVQLEAAQAAKAGQPKALVVNAVVADSPAAQAGLRPGDLLLAVDGQALGEVSAAGGCDCGGEGGGCECHTSVGDESCCHGKGHHGGHHGGHGHPVRLPDMVVGKPAVLRVLRGDQVLDITVSPVAAGD